MHPIVIAGFSVVGIGVTLFLFSINKQLTDVIKLLEEIIRK